MKKGIIEQPEKTAKPKATAKKKTGEGKTDSDSDTNGYIIRLIKAGVDCGSLDKEMYTRKIDDMVRFISHREGITTNQVKTYAYQEMHRVYGYSDSDERMRFLKKNGKTPNSGVEMMYDNEEYRPVYYNVVANRLSKAYGI